MHGLESIHHPYQGQGDRTPRNPLVRLRWVARDFRADLEEVRSLTLEERGCLASIRALYLARSGNLPDDATFLARNLAISTRVWRRLRARLLDLDLLHIEDDRLVCPRCAAELEEAADRLERAAADRQPTRSTITFVGLNRESLAETNPPESRGINGLASLQEQEQESPPNPPQGGEAPEGDPPDADDAFRQVWSAWPLPGRRRERIARWHWRNRLAAGVPLDQLRQACLDRARDRQERVIGLATFLARLDLAGSPASAPIAGQGDRLALVKLDAGRVVCGRPRAWLERAYAVLGEDGVLAVARRAMALELDARASWELIERTCRQTAN